MALAIVCWSWADDMPFGDHPLGIGVLFLPAIALCGIGVDFIMANRRVVTGALIARLAVPLTTLCLLIVTGTLIEAGNPSLAIGCYGFGSVVGLLLCAWTFFHTSPAEFFSARPNYRRRKWLADCLSFGVHGFLASWILRISVLVMEALPVPETEVAYLAAAMDSGCLILLLSKSTDKMF